jgi:hypothetical protein
LTNVVYIASTDANSNDAKSLAKDMVEPLQRLTRLVSKMLSLPVKNFEAK